MTATYKNPKRVDSLSLPPQGDGHYLVFRPRRVTATGGSLVPNRGRGPGRPREARTSGGAGGAGCSVTPSPVRELTALHHVLAVRWVRHWALGERRRCQFVSWGDLF